MPLSMLAVIALVNVWGLLDATLRYPVVYDFSSLFSIKQILLLAAKMFFYALSFRSITLSRMWFFDMVLLNIVVLPLAYLLALPFDLEDSFAPLGNSDYDVDVAVRIFRFVARPRRWRECAKACRWWIRGVVLALARRSPTVSKAVCSVIPSYRKVLLPTGREV